MIKKSNLYSLRVARQDIIQVNKHDPHHEQDHYIITIRSLDLTIQRGTRNTNENV